MSSCCGNELIYNSALSEVVSTNLSLLVKLVNIEYGTASLLIAVIVISLTLVAIVRRTRLNKYIS